MADFLGLPDAIELGQVTPTTVADILKLVQLATLAKYTVVISVAGGVLSARCIPTTPEIGTALTKAAAGL